LNPLPEHHIAVLRQVQRLWPERHIIVIGASAVACHIGLSWRGTIDLDLSIAAALRVCDRRLEGLGWHRGPGAPQRWTTPTGAMVDVVPAARTQIRRGGFEWPDGGAAMSLVGFRLAFADAVPLAIGRRFKVRIASLRSLVLLKMAAYVDRPWERDSDLEDLAQILSGFLPGDAPARWSDQVVELGLEYEDVGPYLLGREIGGVADASERRLVQKFANAIADPEDRLSTLARMARHAPAGWTDPDRLALRWTAFRRGLESRRRRAKATT